jgi:hypothetical protein
MKDGRALIKPAPLALDQEIATEQLSHPLLRAFASVRENLSHAQTQRRKRKT